MRNIHLTMLTDEERNILYDMMVDDKEDGYRAKIILLKDDGYTVPEIRRATNHHDSNIRKWIHHFNEKGLDGIISKIHKHKSIRIIEDMEKKDYRDSSQKSKKRLFTTIFNVVVRCTGCWIYYKGDKPS